MDKELMFAVTGITVEIMCDPKLTDEQKESLSDVIHDMSNKLRKEIEEIGKQSVKC